MFVDYLILLLSEVTSTILMLELTNVVFKMLV